MNQTASLVYLINSAGNTVDSETISRDSRGDMRAAVIRFATRMPEGRILVTRDGKTIMDCACSDWL